MIASLPIYFRPELSAVYEKFWQTMRRRLRRSGIEAPDSLSYPERLNEHWQNPDLLFSQTCGMPFRTYLKGKVHLVGTPDAGLPDCQAGHYCSLFVVHSGDARRHLKDFAAAAFAFNSDDSHSGWAAALFETETAGVEFGSFLETGSHLSSCHAIAEGQAEIAAIDAHSWRLITRFDGLSSRLRTIGSTAASPSPPFITARAELVDALCSAVISANRHMNSRERMAMGFLQLLHIPAAHYFSVPEPSPTAAHSGRRMRKVCKQPQCRQATEFE